MDRRRRFSAFVASGRDPRSTILQALQFAREFLPESCLDERARVKAAIIIEELVSNSLRYGGQANDLSLWLSLDDTGDAVVLELEDDGAPFDPTCEDSFAGPNPETGGGIGLAIVRAWGEDLTYARRSDRNCLQLTIR
ncbi:ATP-binding protein [uncultured Erythrobacter sp.]|uniref:ATP-binding protein n=1 Tax=uncultured Erythrobacter sp. TaxID=263913 RepID=UPI00260755AB|nr:ATP-binding protein [uncultured Erythrobacter sp.]